MEVESTYADAVAVKLSYDGQMRRFPFNGGSFTAFYEQVKTVLALEQDADLVLKYTDEENDLITLTSDLELKSAIAPGQLLRVIAALRNKPAPCPGDERVRCTPMVDLPPNTQFYQPYHQQPAEKRDKKCKKDKEAKKDLKDREKKEKKHAEKMERKQRKMFKRMENHGHHAHHPYFHPNHPHYGHHAQAHGPYGHGPHGPHVHHHNGPFSQANPEQFIARFVSDATIEDGTVVPPNTPFVKTWRLRNEGATWPANCGLFFVAKMSDNLSAPAYLPLGQVVAPQQEIEVSVPLVSPEKAGRYTAYFRMCTAEGRRFGQRVWVSVVVPSADGSSSEGEKEADKYEALVDVVLRNELFRNVGLKRHWVFRQLQKNGGDVDRVITVMSKKVEKKMRKQSKKAAF